MEPRDNLKYLAIGHSASQTIVTEYAQDTGMKDIVKLFPNKIYRTITMRSPIYQPLKSKELYKYWQQNKEI